MNFKTVFHPIINRVVNKTGYKFNADLIVIDCLNTVKMYTL